jgi:hypothetical protein
MTVASAAVSACLVVVEGCEEGVKLRLRFKALSLAGFVELTTECVGHEERITEPLRFMQAQSDRSTPILEEKAKASL